MKAHNYMMSINTPACAGDSSSGSVPSSDEDLRLPVVDLPVAPVSELKWGKKRCEGFYHLRRSGEERNAQRNCTNIVVCGIFNGRDRQHQHQRHEGCEPGQRGDLWNQLRGEGRLCLTNSSPKMTNKFYFSFIE